METGSRNVSIPSIVQGDYSRDDWEMKRRPELLEHFEREVYGTMPKTGFETSFTVTASEDVLAGLAEKRNISVSIKLKNSLKLNNNLENKSDNIIYKFNFLLLIPKHRGSKHEESNHRDGKAPANILIYNNEGNAAPEWARDIDINKDFTNPYWPAKILIENGMAAAIFITSEIESDNKDSFPSGLVKFFRDHMDEEYTGGCISAWAFATSRIVDYLSECPEIDEDFITVTGHSRCGKTALWAGAMDERIYCSYSNNSGCGGAAMGKLTEGEKIEQITAGFPHWFADNYRKYSGKEESMDFDQHMLLALIAPRLLYVASGSEDYWSGPKAEFAGAYYASEAYKVYDLPGLITEEMKMPDIRQPLHEGKIGYHLRAGGHDLSLYDWMMFLNFINKNRAKDQTKDQAKAPIAEILVSQRADPYIVKADDGYYYFTGSYPMLGEQDPEGYDRVILRRSKTIEGLKDAEEISIWDEKDSQTSFRFIWAPEMHKINGKWYVLYAGSGQADNVWNINCRALRCTGDDPYNDKWEEIGKFIGLPDDENEPFSDFSLDMTYFENKGKHYVIWAQKIGTSNLYMAEIDPEKPWQLTSKSIKLSSPTYDWEKIEIPVNEGASVLKHGNRIFIVYSASATGPEYCIGMLYADIDSDLMDLSSWTKSDKTLLTSDDLTEEYGPGHNSFTVDEDGNDIFVYHSRSQECFDNKCQWAKEYSLYDPCRSARVRPVIWTEEGFPILNGVESKRD